MKYQIFKGKDQHYGLFYGVFLVQFILNCQSIGSIEVCRVNPVKVLQDSYNKHLFCEKLQVEPCSDTDIEIIAVTVRRKTRLLVLSQ